MDSNEKKLLNDRIKDINERGINIKVYDYDNSTKRLIDCNIWCDKNNNYVKPIEIVINRCFIL